MASQCSQKNFEMHKHQRRGTNLAALHCKLFASADVHSNLALKHSAPGVESASSNDAASADEDNVDDDDEDDSNDNDSEQESDTDYSDNDDVDDEHAGGDEGNDSNDSSNDGEEQDYGLCRKCEAETSRCDFCSEWFCSHCSTKRRWRKLHPDTDYDSDVAEDLDLKHVCFNCYGNVMEDAAEHGYDDML